MSREVEAYESLARLSEQDAARDFKEAAVLGFVAGVATLIGYEVFDRVPNEVASESAANTVLVAGALATGTVVIAGVTAGYLRKREANQFRKEAEELAKHQQ